MQLSKLPHRFCVLFFLGLLTACNVSDEPSVAVGNNSSTTPNNSTSGASDAGSSNSTSANNSTSAGQDAGNTSGDDAGTNMDAGMTGECTAADTTACGAPANATVSCDVSSGAGQCSYSCEPGYSDLNDDLGSPAGDGCEATCAPTNGGTELCDGIDNDCNGIIDDGFSVGDACSAGIGACEAMGEVVCSTDGTSSDCDATPGTPDNETCDGIDNNCDGTIDEGNPDGGGMCATGLQGICAAGTEACVAGNIECQQNVQPAAENCGSDNTGNGSDDDCDGDVDEGCAACANGATQFCYTGPSGTETTGACRAGTQTCTNGAYGACQGEVLPASESCNNIDDDCDGQTDETFANKGTSCSVGVGACRNSGTFVCTTDGGGTTCSATPGAPSVEICNGVDDDCDGRVDESLTQACGTTDVGACSFGTASCSNGSYGLCLGSVEPSLETCNNIDDNCNGQVDENVTRQCGVSDVGACSYGVETCSAGSFGLCTGAVLPRPERCGDNRDNDCDGFVDEGCIGGCSGPNDCPLLTESCCYNPGTQQNECLDPNGPGGPYLCVQ